MKRLFIDHYITRASERSVERIISIQKSIPFTVRTMRNYYPNQRSDEECREEQSGRAVDGVYNYIEV